ncbi:DUF6355 family natural product biosynthesis protein [Fodinicola acaciae]|uniref:DUF6355 family natural product biosynthesis protein n=1 Tax=Fodinicola acaciae TaxID=2681555 RepID=UPI0013D21F44|nr:DUF6355 family natural product biosynthesis protein [Fodinicola acaciae]
MRRGILVRIGAVALLAVAMATGNVSAASAAKPCGYSESEGHAWYNHCTSDGSWIWIKIDYPVLQDRYDCVGPGLTILGSSSLIRNAYYTGDLCNHA